MSLLNHQELALVWGLPPLPQDSNSNESIKEYINLLTAGQNGGIVLDSLNGWSPNIPGLKNDGIWSESAISPGRRLIAGERSNATEIMNIEISGATYTDYYAERSRLERLIERCREFWTSEYQIDPVYLVWHAANAPGAQYALIYNLNLALNDADDNSVPPFTVTGTLEMEREVAWRWEVPPGGNPKRWAYYKRGELELWNANTADLVADDTENYVYSRIQNKREWQVGQLDILSRNYLDIPAADIPGDAPALACVSLEVITEGSASASPGTFFVGRVTKDKQLKQRDGGLGDMIHVLNFGDATTVTDATIEADTGAPASNNGATGQRGRISFATPSDAQRFAWTQSTETKVSLATLRGRWAFFARLRLSAAGTVTCHLSFQSDTIILPTVETTNQGSGGTGNTTYWGLVYLGQVMFPFIGTKTMVGADGRGISIGDNSVTDLRIAFYAARTSGTPVLYCSDLIMIPVDEPSARIENATSLSANPLTVDNTGYFGHGLPDQIAQVWAAGNHNIASTSVLEMEGKDITLLPGLANRLLFLGWDNQTGADDKRSSIADVYDIRVNIVPRGYGIRNA